MRQKGLAQDSFTSGRGSIMSGRPALVAILTAALILFAGSFNAAAQSSNGSNLPKTSDTNGKADQNLKSIARVNPSTLAMEMDLTLMTYPGRNGNNLPVGFSYSSKIWRMEPAVTWWYSTPAGVRRYVTDVNAVYAERTSAGWTSNLTPPRIDETLELYDQRGKPYTDFLGVLSLNALYEENIQALIKGDTNNLIAPCGLTCEYRVTVCVEGGGCETSCLSWIQNYCTVYPGGGDQTELPPQDQSQTYYVKRVRVAMSDGSMHEFRKSDAVFGYCMGENNPTNGNNCEQQGADLAGTFLAVDGSGMKLVRPEPNAPDQRIFLYLPDGGRYIFPPSPQPLDGHYASEFIDVNGNKMSFTQTTQNDVLKRQWTDTMGRTIVDPMPHNWQTQTLPVGVIDANLPGLDNQVQDYKLVWLPLKPVGCENSTDPNCGAAGGEVPGALENQGEKLFYTMPRSCFGNTSTPVAAGEILFGAAELGYRTCGPFRVEDVNGTPTTVPIRFNPTVLAEVRLPNGKSYKFKYNRHGEITKVTYPAGSYETFLYAQIPTMSGEWSPVFNQANRGVVERRVYNSAGTLEQRWQYSASINNGQTPYPVTAPYKVTTIASSKDNPNANGITTERFLIRDPDPNPNDRIGNYGFDDPRAGMPIEEITKDELGNIKSRTLTDYVVAPARPGGDARAKRDARPSRSVSINIEGNKALATLSRTEYDDAGSADPEHFSHLNVKRKKGYHYKALDLNTATGASLETIAMMFGDEALLASVSETDYQYDPGYKARGIPSLPVETRLLNPADAAEVLVRTQTVFDESAYLVADSGFLTGSLAATWIDPLNDQTIPANSRMWRARPTTSKTWQEETGSWLQKHTQYDQYGNVRKAWDVSGDPTRFTETRYSSGYACAYPTTVISPAPDPTDTHGTSQTSQSTTMYDYMTGLTLAATNDFGQTTRTEYDDPLLRPTRVSGVNIVVPVTETIYDDDNLTVKVRKQIDGNNWDESITYADSLGRPVKKRVNDSQGDVVVRTKYDLMGHAVQVSNPYRVDAGGSPAETVYWTKTRYDELGRNLQSFAPAAENATGDSLGTTHYDLAVAGDSLGTVVETTDAAGRKSRAIKNALGQVIRVDEPSSTNTLDPLPAPSATPTPTPDPDPSPTPHCVINCPNNNLLDAPYPMHSTYYTYDALGKMVMVRQGAQKRFFKYDSFGRLIRVRQPEQEHNPGLDLADAYNTEGKWSAGFTYDVFGNVRRSTDANGVNVISEYDRANRAVRRCYTKPGVVTAATACDQLSSSDLSANTPPVEKFYDGKGLSQVQSPNYAKGKLTKVASSISETRYTHFDSLGRLLQSEQVTDGKTYPSRYEYNLSGALVQETYPSGRTVRNNFESDGDLASIQSRVASSAPFKTYASDFSYTTAGGVLHLKFGNGLWETTAYNSRQQITELALGTSATDASLWRLNYEYGELESDGTTVNQTKNNGNIAKQTISFSGLAQPFVQTYKYDSLERLVEAREANGGQQTWKQNFGYDRYGNRTDFAQTVGQTTLPIDKFTHPTINPLTNRFNAGQDYAYDKNGNLTADPYHRQFTFDGENKQTEVRDANGVVVGRYFYDGEGRRVKKHTFYQGGGQPSEVTVFVYDGRGKLVAEYSTQPPPSNPTTNYTTIDKLGTPRVITNASGSVTSRRDFMPFGEELGPDPFYRTQERRYGVTDAVRQRFAGYEKDTETGFDFAEARYYNSQHGRFTAVDPLLASGKSANPQTFNRYVYTSNNPVVRIDADGKIWGRADDGTVRWFAKKLGAGFKEFRPPNWTYLGVSGRWVRLNANNAGWRYVSAPKTAPSAPTTMKPFGPLGPMQKRDDSTTPGTMEDVLTNPKQYILQAIDTLDTNIRNGVYTIMPDYIKFQWRIPLVIDLEFSFNKDYRSFLGFSTPLGSYGNRTDFNILDPNKPKSFSFRPIPSASIGYFTSGVDNEEDRRKAMGGGSLSATVPIGPVGVGVNKSTPEGDQTFWETPTAVEIGTPSAGLNIGGSQEVLEDFGEWMRKRYRKGFNSNVTRPQ